MELNKDNMKRAMVLILYTVVILALAFHMEYVAAFFKAAFRLLFPFLAGAAIAFILNVPMRFIENRILGEVLKMKEDSRLKRPASLLLAIFFCTRHHGCGRFGSRSGADQHADGIKTSGSRLF